MDWSRRDVLGSCVGSLGAVFAAALPAATHASLKTGLETIRSVVRQSLA
jgi:hypothetical protein